MKKPLRLYLMIIFIFLAGGLHLYAPEKFLGAIPSFIPFPLAIIYITGLLEIVLASLLLSEKTQDFAAKALALYLIILLPIHVYVSYYGIEMFGVNSHFGLWVRTGFQFVLYFWALSIQKESWVIKQTWKDVLFIHYRVPPEKIKHLLPFDLDLYDNQAVLSVVPFYMSGIRFPFLPSIPSMSNLWELNIRTYVNVNGVKGIYFFTLETDSKIGEFVAKNFFHLPYRYSKIKASIAQETYTFEHSRNDLSFKLKADLEDERQKSNFDNWALERYSLFTEKNGVFYQGVVNHIPWKLAGVKITQLDNQFTKMVLPDSLEILGVSYSSHLNVSFKNFKRINISPVTQS